MSKTAASLSIQSEHRLRSETLAFDLDVYYPRLADYTPKSVFVPMKRTEAEAIIHFQGTRYLGRATLTASDVAALEGLESRLAKALEESTELFHGNGAMLRLCGRSPKDGNPFNPHAVWEQYSHELKQLLDAGESLNANTRLRAIGKVNYMKVSSAKDAMSFLLSSERVFSDCRDWLEYGEPEQVVLREWVPGIKLEYEFRVFVCKSQITAISQYDHYAVYPDLVPLKDTIERLIHAKWAVVQPLLGESRYVIDFAYLPELNDVIVVELSPFLPSTGAALFSWKGSDGDRLRNGPYEFRLNQQVREGLDDVLDSNWDQRWQERVDTYEEYLASAGFTTSTPAYSLKTTGSGASSQPVQQPARGSNQRGHLSIVTRFLQSPVCVFVLGFVLSSLFLHYLPGSSTVGTLLSPPPSSSLVSFISNLYLHPTVSSVLFGVTTVVFFSCLSYLRRSHRPRHNHELNGSATKVESKENTDEPRTLLFVYGTLKKGFHWHNKFLSFCEFLDSAETVEAYPLVLGDCGVPYLLASMPGKGHNVKGEVYSVDPVSLLGLDEYEGISKGYYTRTPIDVKLSSSGLTAKADVYYLLDPPERVTSQPVMLKEYTLEEHKRCYNPIQHIRVKQERYLERDESTLVNT